MSGMPAGMDMVLRNLSKEIEGIKGRSMKGLIRATIIVRRSMDKDQPKIPVDVGNLRSSYFVVTSGGETPEGSTAVFRDDPKAKSSSLSGTAAAMASRHAAVVNQNRLAISGSQNLYVVFGFSAFYAWYVHEKLGASTEETWGVLYEAMGQSFNGTRWSRPGSGPKFFESALNRSKQQMLDVIAKEARIP